MFFLLRLDVKKVFSKYFRKNLTVPLKVIPSFILNFFHTKDVDIYDYKTIRGYNIIIVLSFLEHCVSMLTGNEKMFPFTFVFANEMQEQ